MPIADPYAALLTLQPAIESGGVKLRRCKFVKSLWHFMDFPGGEPRTTYVTMSGGLAESIVQLLPSDPIEGIPCLALGYATIEGSRGHGLASATVVGAIEDMSRGLAVNGIRQFYVEAIVSTSNIASQRVAERTLGPPNKSGTDHFSGEPILQYLKLVEA